MKILALLSAAALAGCATTEPTPTANGQYLVSSENFFGYGSSDGRKERSIEKAQEFCATQGGKVALVSGSNGHGIPLLTPVGASVTFSCVAPDDPAYKAQTASH